MRVAMLLLLAAAALGGNGGNDWIWFDSRESADKGPRLVLTAADGSSETVRASGDTVLISYLADRIWGGLPRLSLSLGDTNRVLLRFDPPGGAFAKAELVLHANLSQMPPSEPFELGVHRVGEAWSEAQARWTGQPAFDDEPVAKATVEPKEGEIRIDLTAALRKGLPHGLLLKVTKPLAVPAVTAPPAKVPAFQGAIAWAGDVGAAKERAAKEGKLVLALVRGAFGEGPLDFTEEMLLATALLHPRVKALLDERFVPVRVACLPYLHTLAVESPPGPPDGRDPLPALGTSARETKAPALLVATAEGERKAALQSIGTFDAATVEAFLREAAGLPPAPAPPLGVAALRAGRFDDARKLLADDDEGRYWRGALLWRDGERDAATAAWTAIGEDSPWRWKAQARLRWPERMAMCECLLAPGHERGGPGAVERAATWLAAQQRPDGSWANATAYTPTEAAITALCARALRAHGKEPEAVRRAVAWLRTWMENTDPAEANAWSAGYTLDLFCDLAEKDEAFRADAQRAVRFVEGGQAPNGAWSYSRNWGMRWTGGFGGWEKTDQGRFHSMNTGPSLVSLLRAKSMGLEVDGDVLAKGREVLLKMRSAAGVYTYTYPGNRTFDERRASIGRGPVCERALFGLGAVEKVDMEKALAAFLEWRAGLRGPVKMTASWTPPSMTSSYFFFFAYLHAAEALDDVGNAKAREALREDIRDVMEPDGTWVDHPETGKCYATAAALLVLR